MARVQDIGTLQMMGRAAPSRGLGALFKWPTMDEYSEWPDRPVGRTLGNISGDVGLVSAGRVDKDTPPRTTPSHTSKSSAMDISSHIF